MGLPYVRDIYGDGVLDMFELWDDEIDIMIIAYTLCLFTFIKYGHDCMLNLLPGYLDTG